MHIHKSQLPALTLIDVIISRSLLPALEEARRGGGRRSGGLGAVGPLVPGLAARSGPSTGHGEARREPCEPRPGREVSGAELALTQMKLEEQGKDPPCYTRTVFTTRNQNVHGNNPPQILHVSFYFPWRVKAEKTCSGTDPDRETLGI